MGFVVVAAFLLIAPALLASLHAQGTSAVKDHGPIAWTESLDGARKTAAKQKKVVLVDFTATWCGPCKMMLATTYRDKAVVEQSKRFVPVLIDVDKQTTIAQKYKIEVIPTIVFLDARGNVLGRSTGYQNAATLLKQMADAQKKANL